MRLFPENMDGILLFGQRLCTWDIKLKIYWVSKSVPVAKTQNPQGQNFGNLIFFYLRRQGYTVSL